jgi:hypothetical protein
MPSTVWRTTALLSQFTRSKAPSRSPHIPRTVVAVRSPYILSLVLAVAIAVGLRQYLQTGNESKITDWVPAHDKTGEFKRGQSAFRNFISRESGAQFPPEKDRYHLYVSYACPWGTLNKLCSSEDKANIGSLRQPTERSSSAN